MSNLTKIGKEFKSMVELQTFAEAQTKTIVTQSKHIQNLEGEVKHLKELLGTAVPVVQAEKNVLEVSDEESIARMELRKLRDKSMGMELTMEECKKVEVYSKILNTSLNKPKIINVNTKKLSPEELIAIAEGPDDPAE